MRSIRDIMAQQNAERAKKLTEYQRGLVDEFNEALELWDKGEFTLSQVEDASGTPYIRFMCMSVTSPVSHEWELMQRFFEAISARDRGPGVMTTSGWVSEFLIHTHQGKIVDAVDPDGVMRQVAVFPTGYALDEYGKEDVRNPIYGEAPTFSYRPGEEPEHPKPSGWYEWNEG